MKKIIIPILLILAIQSYGQVKTLKCKGCGSGTDTTTTKIGVHKPILVLPDSSLAFDSLNLPRLALSLAASLDTASLRDSSLIPKSYLQARLNSLSPLPSLTSGSILFSNGTTVSQDNANYFWDNTNKKVVYGGVFRTNTQLVTNGGYNKALYFLEDMSGQSYLTQQTYYYNGGYIATSSVGVGLAAIRLNKGGFVVGVGGYSLFGNSGDNVTATGYSSGQSNTGNNSNFTGMYSGQNNTGGSVNVTGYQSARNNTGMVVNGNGENAFMNNTGSFVSGTGYQVGSNNTGDSSIAYGTYALINNNSARRIAIGENIYSNQIMVPTIVDTFASANISGTSIAITAHGFGTVGKKVNLQYNTLTGTAVSGLITGTIYQFTIVDANTLSLATITGAGSGTYSLTKDVDKRNSIILGNNITNTKANQTILGGEGNTEVRFNGALAIDSFQYKRIVIIGDSYSTITHWPAFLADSVPELARYNIVNYAISGQPTDLMVPGYASTAHVSAPKRGDDFWLFCYAGINDLWGLAPPTADSVYGNLKYLWSHARSDGYKVVAFTIIKSLLASTAGNTARIRLDSLILSDPSLYDYVIDVDKVFDPSVDFSVFADSTHLNAAGWKMFDGAIANTIRYKPYTLATSTPISATFPLSKSPHSFNTTTYNNLGLSGFTNGSMLFYNNGIAQDNSNFFYDNVNKRLGIGTRTPQRGLDISKAMGNGTVPFIGMQVNDATRNFNIMQGIISTAGYDIAGLWAGTYSPTVYNFALGFDNTGNNYFNAPSGSGIYFQIAGLTALTVNTNKSLTAASSITATQYKLSALNTAPSSSTDTGTLGEIRVTSSFIYICTATNVWVRAALATW